MSALVSIAIDARKRIQSAFGRTNRRDGAQQRRQRRLLRCLRHTVGRRRVGTRRPAGQRRPTLQRIAATIPNHVDPNAIAKNDSLNTICASARTARRRRCSNKSETPPTRQCPSGRGPKLAALALRREDWIGCEVRCRELLKQDLDNDASALVLRILAKSFEARSEFYQAALCYSGMMPNETAKESRKLPSTMPIAATEDVK